MHASLLRWQTACLTAVALSLCAPATAQLYGEPADPAWPFETDLSLAVGLPQGDLRNHADDVGVGLDLFVGLGLGDLPVVLGGELGFVTYSSSTDRETVSGTPVEVKTDNNILLGHFVTRIRPRDWRIVPYLDGLIGFKLFFTDTRVRNRFTDERIAGESNQTDVAFSYGVGGGVMVPLPGGSVNLVAGARYLPGGKATYVDEGATTVRSSDSDLVLLSVGVGGTF